MIGLFAHFGLAVIILIADVLLCAFTTYLWSKDDDMLDDLFIILAIINTAGFAIALSFLILGV